MLMSHFTVNPEELVLKKICIEKHELISPKGWHINFIETKRAKELKFFISILLSEIYNKSVAS